MKELLGLIENGKLTVALNKEIKDALEKLKELTGDSRKVVGEITLKLKVSMTGNEVEVSPEITSKLPKAPRGRGFFWLNKDGDLVVEHPNQMDMDFAANAKKAEPVN